jgi:tripartite-type tricarboxylate transporter receptor subunit TctC
MKRRTAISAIASTPFVATPWLQAQSKYPERAITLVVPTAPGGTTDFTARLIAEPLSKALGKPVVIDNKPGGSGNIGNQFAARAKPDGYTFLLAYSGYQVGNPHLFKNTGWEAKDFAAVSMLTRAPQLITIKKDLPVNTLAELIAFAKKNPGKLNYASSGMGSIQHIAGELFKQITSTYITHIPYRGSGPAVQDLLGGQVDLFMTTPAAVVQFIKAERLKGLAVTSSTRLASLPQVLTATEAGLKNFNLDSWFALYAPTGTPSEAVQLVNAEIAKILALPEIKKKAEEAGTSVDYMNSAQLADYTKKEFEHWGKVIASAKITAE